MYGNGIGTLNIYLRRGKTLDTKPLWTLTGEQGKIKTGDKGVRTEVQRIRWVRAIFYG